MAAQILSKREEANALTALVLRNGYLEELHAGRPSELLSDPSLSRVTDSEMKQLMIECSALLSEFLELKERDPEAYWKKLLWAHDSYSKNWDTTTSFQSARRSRTRSR